MRALSWGETRLEGKGLQPACQVQARGGTGPDAPGCLLPGGRALPAAEIQAQLKSCSPQVAG